ncbi:uncharacterized protein LOC130700749 isoform X2 [Daphnia carinata]|uniref:uncharacterized protein LOC130700749 isoform X2 n=1 Tax=Daphnia carinata TaxID=120202 RepID=UPI00257F09E8|nr:uncharacterized protein LOC130700749 isoform X2 [Daphnia carinata]
MKIALVFVVCFVSLTLQQNVFWSYPGRRIPYYSMYNHNIQDDLPILAALDPAGHPLYPNNYGARAQGGLQERTLEESDLFQQLEPKAEGRTFGLNNLVSVILSSLSLSSTSTTYTTTTSTITAGTVLTCFTRTMFNSTTACRRKRDALLMISEVLIGDSDDEDEPFGDEQEWDDELPPLPRAKRDVDPSRLIVSSKTESDVHVNDVAPKQTESSVNGYFRQNRAIVTSSLTSYTVFYSTSTRIVTNIASASGLSCLPSGFTLC